MQAQARMAGGGDSRSCWGSGPPRRRRVRRSRTQRRPARTTRTRPPRSARPTRVTPTATASTASRCRARARPRPAAATPAATHADGQRPGELHEARRRPAARVQHGQVPEHPQRTSAARVRKGWPRRLVSTGPAPTRAATGCWRTIPTRDGFDRDEYPPAVGRGKGKGLERGRDPRGWKADVRYVPSSENRSHGASLGAKLGTSATAPASATCSGSGGRDSSRRRWAWRCAYHARKRQSVHCSQAATAAVRESAGPHRRTSGPSYARVLEKLRRYEAASGHLAGKEFWHGLSR